MNRVAGFLTALWRGIVRFYVKASETEIDLSLDSVKNMLEASQRRNELLEELVNQRTQLLSETTSELKIILDTLDQGIMMIDTNCCVFKEYSGHLTTIIGHHQIAGENIDDLLLRTSQLSPDRRHQVITAIKTILGDQEFNFSANSHLLPSELDIDVNGKQKNISLDWHPVLDGAGLVVRLLISIRDVTELRSLQIQADQQANELNIIGKILSMPLHQFEQFLERTQFFINENRTIISREDGFDVVLIPLLFRNMHTIKGNSRVLGFSDVADLAHVAENRYQLIRDKGRWIFPLETLYKDLNGIENIVLTYEEIYERKIKRSNATTVVEKNKEMFIEAKRALSALDFYKIQKGIVAEVKALSRFLKVLDSVDLEEALDEILANIPTIAERLEKLVPEVKVDCEGVRISNDKFYLFHDSLTHILVNCLDHGIEAPADRLAKGKLERGVITIAAHESRDEKNVIVEVWDDGQGLDLETIKSIGIKKELCTEEQAARLSDEEISAFLFMSGFSTASSISDLSGRGVGMDAVKEYMEDANGGVVIEFRSDELVDQRRPFKLVLTVPV